MYNNVLDTNLMRFFNRVVAAEVVNQHHIIHNIERNLVVSLFERLFSIVSW